MGLDCKHVLPGLSLATTFDSASRSVHGYDYKDVWTIPTTCLLCHLDLVASCFCLIIAAGDRGDVLKDP